MFRALMASYADVLRIVHGRFVHVGEIVALSKERIEVVSSAVEGLIRMGALKRRPDQRIASTKPTLGDLTKWIRERGSDPNAPLPTDDERRIPLEAELGSTLDGDGREATRWAKCPLCKMRIASTDANAYCPQCGAYLHIDLSGLQSKGVAP
jgi:hypothetical protein